jgi:ribonuclease R
MQERKFNESSGGDVKAAVARDLLAVPFVTIDGASTRDIDDAIYCEQMGEGYRVLIAIADPTDLVKIGSMEDENARLLGASVYARERTVHRMLPLGISEVGASLVAQAERKALVFDVRLSSQLEVTSFGIEPSLIKVAKRLTYDDVADFVSHVQEMQLLPDVERSSVDMVALAGKLARMLLQRRRQSGALALFDLHRLLLSDEDGRLVHFASTGEMIGHVIIQEFMVLCNAQAASYMIEHDVPGIFRNHEAKASAPAAAELANTIEVWMHSKAMEPDVIHGQFLTVAGKAKYGETVKGHYALALPCYAHITSPLRRYADLVNMRQLKAHLRAGRNEGQLAADAEPEAQAALRPLPYSVKDLGVIAADINEAIERRNDERSEGYKSAVKATAQRALDADKFHRLADHELIQAIKLVKDAGGMPDNLSLELIRRFRKMIITDKVCDCLFVEVPRDLLGPSLKDAFSSWIGTQPARAMHMLLHAEQTGFLSGLQISATGQGLAFEGLARAIGPSGVAVERRGSGSRKRDAEQRAAVKLVCELLDLPTPSDAVSSGLSASSGTQVSNTGAAMPNPKGALLELCVQKGLPVPEFQSQGVGPSHAMVFSATVSLMFGQEQLKTQSSGAGTKKEAEAMAASSLYELLRKHGSETEGKTVKPGLVDDAESMAASNAVGRLQELAQRFKASLPTYNVQMQSEHPPVFVATVKSQVKGVMSFTGMGQNKQLAKQAAAAQALDWISKQS